MAVQKQPTKEQIRDYMARRQAGRKPPPDPREIRRQLGWELMEMTRKIVG
ncbi:hypothetical protein [Actimicrobium antarcticum]|uniref:Uncharacterized protein n=1 Tax=Actimicrobium antarcticum TaxID=1051899 RepID=A0ABP7SQ48_9BURK